jgi:8-oxo-dGTP pyrophosphatase MutT (NUDIX family)
MAQKYKVYYNNRLICITGQKDNAIVKKDVKKISWPFDVKEEWQRFKNDKNIRKLYLEGDPGKIWKEFKSLFKYIKAAGGLVINSKGEYLLIFRNNMWDLPKGKMEKGEIPEETALREVEEECGVEKLVITKRMRSSYHIYEFKGKMAIKRSFWFEMKTTSDKIPVPQQEEGIEKAIWVNKSEFEELGKQMFPSVWGILKKIT